MSIKVLILVVVDDSLVLLVAFPDKLPDDFVLILVVVDDSLVLVSNVRFTMSQFGLNPCCSGR